jgi:hypothetical protein
VYEIRNASNEEVRNLFIRLQGGTPLQPQQVRDAWPGDVARFIVSLAGKTVHRPPDDITLFQNVLGLRQDEDDVLEEEDRDDPYVKHRQLCAQALTIFLRRKKGVKFPSTTAKELNAMYEEYTELSEEDRQQFSECLVRASVVFDKALERTRGLKNKIPHLHVFCTFIYLYEQLGEKLVDGWEQDLARHVQRRLRGQEKKFGKAVNRVALQKCYEWWSQRCPRIARDAKRHLSQSEKREILSQAKNKCWKCKKPLNNDVHFHHVKPHAKGGRTTIRNHKPVHSDCHNKIHKQGDLCAAA